ncbi:MAG: hypothetical protein JNL38_31895, partial [Myxococcales bacterium]|nr:hypothetical protein [Myxococcales bacterium]
MSEDRPPVPLHPSMGRRIFLRGAMAGTAVIALGGATYVLANEEEAKKARATLR